MALLDGLSKNAAELTRDAKDPDLRPFALSLAPVHAVTWAQGIIAGWPRWKVVGAYEDRGMIHATHTSRFLGLVDDVHIVFEPDPRGSLVVAKSQARAGKGSFGRNARNLRALARGLQEAERQRRERLTAGAAAGQ